MISPISDFSVDRRAPRIVPPLHADVAGWLAGDPRWWATDLCQQCHRAHHDKGSYCAVCRPKRLKAWREAQARKREKKH